MLWIFFLKAAFLAETNSVISMMKRIPSKENLERRKGQRGLTEQKEKPGNPVLFLFFLLEREQANRRFQRGAGAVRRRAAALRCDRDEQGDEEEDNGEPKRKIRNDLFRTAFLRFRENIETAAGDGARSAFGLPALEQRQNDDDQGHNDEDDVIPFHKRLLSDRLIKDRLFPKRLQLENKFIKRGDFQPGEVWMLILPIQQNPHQTSALSAFDVLQRIADVANAFAGG